MSVMHRDAGAASSFMKAMRSTKARKKLEGLPASFGTEEEVETLDLICKDPILGLKVILSYSVFEKEDVIARSVRLVNEGNETRVWKRSTVPVWIWIMRILRC